MGVSRVLVLLAGVLLGSQLCLGTLDCSGVEGFRNPEEGTSSFLAYKYQSDDISGQCIGIDLLCEASLPVPTLSQKSWFIEEVKDFHGLAYKNNWLQLYNIQCPQNHALHLFPQVQNLLNPSGVCPGGDFATVDTGNEVINLCGANNENSDLFNFGFGLLVESGNATIQFCTDMDNPDPAVFPILLPSLGFVVRATCINFAHTLLPQCVDFERAKIWDGNFVNKINDPFLPPKKLSIPHKRSVEMRDSSPARLMNIRKPRKADLKKLGALRHERFLRKKRFLSGNLVFMLTDGQFAIYDNNVLLIDFNDGTTFPIVTPQVAAFNELIGTRVFLRDAPIRFEGPAVIRHDPGSVTIPEYTIPDIAALLLPSLEVSNIINMLAEYLYSFYVMPYPIIEDTVDIPDVAPFPLDPSNGINGVNYIPETNVPFLKATINEGTCRRVIVRTAVAERKSFPESNIINWCSYFQQSCNAYLRSICDQIAALGLITS